MLMRISDIVRNMHYGAITARHSDGSVDVKTKIGTSKRLKIVGSSVYLYNKAHTWNSQAQEWKRSYPPIKVPSVPFFSTTTETPLYDSIMEDPDYFLYEKGMKAELKMMTPREYLGACARGRYNRSTQAYGVSVEHEMQSAKSSLIKKYAEDMKGGARFPVPVIEYEDGGRISQEGRHRAMAVQKLIDEGYARKSFKMPVLIVRNE